MSFQRIFEMVRRQGLPMVVTDETGKEPVVILPFDVYESLMGADTQTVPVERPTVARPKVETASPATSHLEPVLKDEISLEERFYVEASDG